MHYDTTRDKLIDEQLDQLMRKERIMKYKIGITQEIKYRETLEGEFDNLTDVEHFIEIVAEHFENVSFNIEILMDGEEG